LQYLLDIRKASSGQQDITLFFSRLLHPTVKDHLISFETEYRGIVKKILDRHKQRAKEAKKKQKQQKSEAKPTEENTEDVK
jgi:predicted patatin/cPLA2 family phospholipase